LLAPDRPRWTRIDFRYMAEGPLSNFTLPGSLACTNNTCCHFSYFGTHGRGAVKKERSGEGDNVTTPLRHARMSFTPSISLPYPLGDTTRTPEWLGMTSRKLRIVQANTFGYQPCVYAKLAPHAGATLWKTGAAYDPENSSRVYIARHRYLRI